MWEFVNEMPDGVLKVLFRILNSVTTVCQWIYNILFTTLSDVISDLAESINLPQWAQNVIEWLLDRPQAWVYNYSLFELIFGFGLILVLIFGIVKFFTDIVL